MTEKIELKYKGLAHGGPWHGQQIKAEFPLISHNEGGYEYGRGPGDSFVWLWRSRDKFNKRGTNEA